MLKKIKQDILRFTGNLVLYRLINVLCKSLKITAVNRDIIESLNREGKKYILVFWHGTMLLPWFMHRSENAAALISQSKDGDLLADILKNWGYQVIRGSSSKGGSVALGIMVDYAKNGASILVTPDGPRGPALKMKAGAVVTAKKSGLPLVLAGAAFKTKRQLNSWDKFSVPKFFTSAKIVYSDPVYIDAGLDYNSTSDMILKCEDMLNKLQHEAEAF